MTEPSTPRVPRLRRLMRLADWLALPFGMAAVALSLPAGVGAYLLADHLVHLVGNEALTVGQLGGGLAGLAFCLRRTLIRDHPHPAPLPAPAGNPSSGLRSWPPYFFDLALWGLWLAWVSLWWNRGFYPFDHGREATISYMWLQGARPYADHFMTHHTLLGVLIHAGMISLFGFAPYTWRLAFVLVYGLCLWLVFRLLCKVVSRPQAWAITAPLGIFITNMEMSSYWSYYWNGWLLALLAVLAFTKIPWRQSAFRSAPWIVTTAFLAVASGVSIPQIGLVLQISFGLVVLARLAGDGDRGKVLAQYALLVAASLLFAGAVVLMLHWLGWLPGFLGWLKTLPRAVELQYQSQGVLDVLGRWQYAFAMSREKNPLVSLVGVLAFGGAVAWLWAWRGNLRPCLGRGLSMAYYGVSLALILWCLWDLRGCLDFLRKHLLDAVYFIPSLAFALSVAIGLTLLLSLRRASDRQRQETYLWLLLLLVGQGIFWGVTQTHTGSSYCMGMSLLTAPVVWAFVWVKAPQRLGFRWPRGMALALALLLSLIGISFKVNSIPHQASWWEPFPSFQYPALRHMRDPNATELDKVLFAAREVVEKKGRVLVYPSHITIYPLVGQMPPLPFPDLNWKLYCYPQDPGLWRQTLLDLEQAPPDLLIVQRDALRRRGDWDRFVADKAHVPQVIAEAMKALYEPGATSSYRLVHNGKAYHVFRRSEAASEIGTDR